MTAWERAAEHLYRARMELFEAHHEGVPHDRVLPAYHDVMIVAQRHGLMHEAEQSLAPRLRSVA